MISPELAKQTVEAARLMIIAMVDDEELIKSYAKGFKKMYDALVAEGFGSDQAMQIISIQGLGAKMS